MKLIIAFFLAATALLNTSCTKDIREAFGEIFELSGKLGEKFGEGSPNVSIGEKGIAATFVNTSFNNLPPDEKKSKAHEISLFIKDNYAKIERIEEITVVFGVHRSFFGFQYSNNLDAYPFKVKELNSINKPPEQ